MKKKPKYKWRQREFHFQFLNARKEYEQAVCVGRDNEFLNGSQWTPTALDLIKPHQRFYNKINSIQSSMLDSEKTSSGPVSALRGNPGTTIPGINKIKEE